MSAMSHDTSAAAAARFLLLSEADVRAVLPMGDLIDVMASALGQFSAGGVTQPVRSVISVGSQQAFFGTMPAYMAGAGTAAGAAMGAKLVTVFGGNAARGLPTHLAVIVLLDPETGALLAMLDGRYITEARTAAVSAVSSRLLARKEAASLAIIGSGVQARSHLEALSHVHGAALRDVRVWSPTPGHRHAFAHELTTAARPIVAADSVEAAVAGADIIALVTASSSPVLDTRWVKDGAHVIAVGACRPTHREVDPALVARARLFVDSRAAALVEAGDIVMAIDEQRFGPDHIVAEIGDLVNATAAGRRGDEEITLFKSLGLAVEDVSAADLAWRRARERGIGQQLSL
jgi:ornithine cyclodeaminase